MTERLLRWTVRPGGLPLAGATVAAFVRRAPPSVRELDLGPIAPTTTLAWAIAETPALHDLERVQLVLVGGDRGADRAVLTALASRSMPHLADVELAGDIDDALLAHLADPTLRPLLARLSLRPLVALSPRAVARLRGAQPWLVLETELRGVAAVSAAAASMLADRWR
jgi:hypothetical protein